MAPVPTLRRLNDRERYWALTFPQWAGVGLAGGFLYAAVRVSPFGTKPTITIVLLLAAFAGTVLLGVSGQALSPLRQIQAITRYRRAPKQWALLERPGRRGLVLSTAPLLEEELIEDLNPGINQELWDELSPAAEVLE